MKKYFGVLILILLVPLNVHAQRGCCSHHGGVAGCSSYGRTICNDGTLSPSCTCNPPIVYGCTDVNAINYNPEANKNNGTCKYEIKGCADRKAKNYNKNANVSDGSCLYESIVKETIEIDYKSQIIEDTTMKTGAEKKIQSGEKGKMQVTYRDTKNESGNTLKRETLEETVIKDATPEIIKKGKTVEISKNSETNKKLDSDKNNFFIIILVSVIGVIICLVLRDKKI